MKGIRIRFLCSLESAKVYIQTDIGFGDVVFPSPEEYDFPTILDFPAPKLRCFSRESAIAEKFESMVKLQELNRRMKDFYDIWLPLRQFVFIEKKLAEAISLTFNRRGAAPRFPMKLQPSRKDSSTPSRFNGRRSPES